MNIWRWINHNLSLTLFKLIKNIHYYLASLLSAKPILLIGLMLLVISLAFIRLSIQQGSVLNANADRSSSIEWLQPVELNVNYPELVSNQSWQFNFAIIEQILWQSNINAKAEFEINWQTAELLEKMVLQLPSKLPQHDLTRLAFLVDNSITQSQAKAFTDLFINYYHYQQDYQDLIKAISQANADEKVKLLKAQANKLKDLQAFYFTEKVAKQLFNKKNTLNNYLNQRLLIRLDKNLSAEVKKDKLLQLKQDYQQHLPRLKPNKPE